MNFFKLLCQLTKNQLKIGIVFCGLIVLISTGFLLQNLALSTLSSKEIGNLENSSKNAATLANQNQFSQSNFSNNFSGSYSDWKAKTELEIGQNWRQNEKR